MELKHIDFTKNELPANGVIYKIKYSLTVERWKCFEKLQNHFAFGLAFSDIEKKISDSITLANSGKSVDAWYKIYDLREGIAYRIEDREHPALLMLSLFIVTDDEDLTQWSEEDQKTKIANWNAEGYDINDFFQLASNLVKNFLPVYKEIFQSTSKEERGKVKHTDKRQSK